VISRAVSVRFTGAVAIALAAAGCLPKIGDHCTTSLDCSQTGQRQCDITQPNGYCTYFNCEPDNCPDSAACVAFNNSLDPACGTVNSGGEPRFERTFCMAPCNQDSDCRAEYVCVSPTERGGLAIDVVHPHDKVCLVKVAISSPADSTGPVPGVCNPAPSGDPLDPYEPGSASGSGGTAGAGGATGGSAGAGGTGMGGAPSGSGGAGGAGAGGAPSGSGGTGGV